MRAGNLRDQAVIEVWEFDPKTPEQGRLPQRREVGCAALTVINDPPAQERRVRCSARLRTGRKVLAERIGAGLHGPYVRPQ